MGQREGLWGTRRGYGAQGGAIGHEGGWLWGRKGRLWGTERGYGAQKGCYGAEGGAMGHKEELWGRKEELWGTKGAMGRTEEVAMGQPWGETISPPFPLPHRSDRGLSRKHVLEGELWGRGDVWGRGDEMCGAGYVGLPHNRPFQDSAAPSSGCRWNTSMWSSLGPAQAPPTRRVSPAHHPDKPRPPR